MAASVVYTVWDGQIVSENRGGVKRDYIPDPLGNTIALVDNTHTVTDTWTYWPYGEVQSHGGSSSTPFTFLGTLGCFVDLLNQLYVRARIMRADLTRWMTVDPIWPAQPSFVYCGGWSTNCTDPSGAQGEAGAGAIDWPGTSGGLGAGAGAGEAGGGGLAGGLCGLGTGLLAAGAVLLLILFAILGSTFTWPTRTLGHPPCTQQWKAAMTKRYHTLCNVQISGLPFTGRKCADGDSCLELCWKQILNQWCGYFRQLVRDNCYEPWQKNVYDTHSDQIMGALKNFYKCQSLIVANGCHCSDFNLVQTLSGYL